MSAMSMATPTAGILRMHSWLHCGCQRLLASRSSITDQSDVNSYSAGGQHLLYRRIVAESASALISATISCREGTLPYLCRGTPMRQGEKEAIGTTKHLVAFWHGLATGIPARDGVPNEGYRLIEG